MNSSSNLYSIQNRNHNTQLTDRLLSIYSLLIILIGTPCNLLCCIIYLQKANRSNSIKIIFGYLAFLDTVVLYTFNLNYVFREFNVDVKITYLNHSNQINSPDFDVSDHINAVVIKKNLEEH
jgi:D-alanyl-lipoteichoic acid acyltransferase DltB (MBOAT superfamily)